MKIAKSSPLYAQLLDTSNSWEIIPKINQFLANGGCAGVYTVDDTPHVSGSRNHFHPSGDIGVCERFLYYARTVELPTEPLDVGLIRIFKTGDVFHAMIQAWIKAIDPEARIEESFEIGDLVRGRIDVIQGNGICVEIKSASSYNYQRFVKEPKPQHVLQTAFYADVCKTDYGILLYVNKDTSEMKEFKIDVMDLSEVYASWLKVEYAVEHKNPSELEYGCQFGSVEFCKCPASRWCAEGRTIPDWGVFNIK